MVFHRVYGAAGELALPEAKEDEEAGPPTGTAAIAGAGAGMPLALESLDNAARENRRDGKRKRGAAARTQTSAPVAAAAAATALPSAPGASGSSSASSASAASASASASAAHSSSSSYPSHPMNPFRQMAVNHSKNDRFYTTWVSHCFGLTTV